MISKTTLHCISGFKELLNGNLETLLPRTHEDYAERIETTYIFEKDGRIMRSSMLEIDSPKNAETRSFVVHDNYRASASEKRSSLMQLMKLAAGTSARLWS